MIHLFIESEAEKKEGNKIDEEPRNDVRGARSKKDGRRENTTHFRTTRSDKRKDRKSCFQARG